MAKEIKICDGVNVQYKGKTHKCDGPWDLWKLFNWDTENDPNAKECASLITRELFCFGTCKFEDEDGREVYIEMIPVKEEE